MSRVLVLLMIGCATTKVPLPPKRPPMKMAVLRSVEGINVEIDSNGYTAFRIALENSRSETLSIVWDQSSFVAYDRRSLGRLVRGKTRMLDAARAQPNTPVPAGSFVVEVAIPEALLDFEPRLVEVDHQGKRLDDGPPVTAEQNPQCGRERAMCYARSPRDSTACERAYEQCSSSGSDQKAPSSQVIDGDAPRELTTGIGRLLLVIRNQNHEATWEAAISFDGTKLPGPQPEPGETEPKQPEPAQPEHAQPEHAR
jgi:hypothetical protein